MQSYTFSAEYTTIWLQDSEEHGAAVYDEYTAVADFFASKALKRVCDIRRRKATWRCANLRKNCISGRCNYGVRESSRRISFSAVLRKRQADNRVVIGLPKAKTIRLCRRNIDRITTVEHCASGGYAYRESHPDLSAKLRTVWDARKDSYFIRKS